MSAVRWQLFSAEFEDCTVDRGHPNLLSATSDGFTLAITYNPTWANRLLLRGSFYQYEVDGTITAHDTQTVLNSSYVEDIDAFCGFIERRDNGTISLFTNTLFNIGTVETTGTDIGFSYDWNSPSLGQFTWTFDVTHVRSFEEISRDALGAEVKRREVVGRTQGDRGIPQSKYTSTIRWTKGNGTLIWRSHLVGELEERCSNFLDGTPDSLTNLGLCSGPNLEDNSASSNTLAATIYQSATYEYTLPHRSQSIDILVGIDNLLNEETPVAIVQHSTDLTRPRAKSLGAVTCMSSF